MGYSLECIFKHLRLHKKIYMAFIIEILIGVVLFTSCINIYFSWTDQLKQLKQQRIGKEVTVSYSSLDFSGEAVSKNPITFNDYQNLSNKYKDNLELSYGSQNYVTAAIKQTQEMFEFTNFFMDSNMYKSLFGSKMEPGIIYAGTSALQSINRLAEKVKSQEKIISYILRILFCFLA